MPDHAIRTSRREQGLCPTCGDKPVEGRVKCAKCAKIDCDRTKKSATKNQGIGLCYCGRPKWEGRSQCQRCIDNRKARLEKKAATGKCWRCPNDARPGTKSCEVCALLARVSSKVRSKDAREAVFDHYGRKCQCPGCNVTESMFLTIDHENGEGHGNKHRAEIHKHKSGTAFYRWLVKQKFPTGFRVLCFNCNCARGFRGYCPHERM